MTTEKKYTPHVHAEVIKAWADGKPIEWCERGSLQWKGIESPRFFKEHEYRVKPEKMVDYTIVFSSGATGYYYFTSVEKVKEFYATVRENFYDKVVETCQGFCKRTTVDGKVVAFEFIPR